MGPGLCTRVEVSVRFLGLGLEMMLRGAFVKLIFHFQSSKYIKSEELNNQHHDDVKNDDL